MATTRMNDNFARLEEILSRRIMVLDGAMGSIIYEHQPTEEDYRGSRFARHPIKLKNCTEVLVLTQPETEKVPE